MSQPKPRRLSDVGGCCGVVIFSTISAGNTALPFSKAWANFDKSPTVENNPACPETPPMRRAVVGHGSAVRAEGVYVWKALA